MENKEEIKKFVEYLMINTKISAETISGLVNCFKELLDDYSKFAGNIIASTKNIDKETKIDILEKSIVGLGNIIVNKINKAKEYTKQYQEKIKDINFDGYNND